MRRLSIAALLVAVTLAPSCTSTGFARVEQPTSREHYHFTDPGAWQVDSDGTLSLEKASDYAPPFRSPRSIALVGDLAFGSFTASVDAMQTGREYGHRDLCFFFGYQSPQRYYYVHLATTPDQNAHNVFLVDDAPRRPLAPVARQGVDWGRGQWHRVRLERLRGRIRVFFDDFERPLFDLLDGTHGAGRIGFGSFDDTGRFDNLSVWAASSSGFNQDPFGR